MHKVVILGASFAALTAIKTLRKQGYKDEIIVIAPRPILFFYPSLIWVPAGLRSEQDLTIELNNFFQRHHVNYQRGKVTGLDPQAKEVLIETGEKIRFDSLIIASGGRFIKKLPGIEHIYTPCEGYEPTKAFSDKLAKYTLLRQQKRRDNFKLVFFAPSKSPGQRLGEKAVKGLLAEMKRRGVETHLGHKMKGFTDNKVMTEGGEFDSDLTLFMPGLTGPAWASQSGLPLSEGGFIQADEHCQIAGFEGIYVAGDSGSFPGPGWLPKQAHIADLQAEAAAKNLLLEIDGKPITHTFKSELVCIVDTLNSGMLVYRDPKRTFLLPKMFISHWAKRAFEKIYLRTYR